MWNHCSYLAFLRHTQTWMRTRQQSKPKNPLAFGTSCHWEGFWWMSQILLKQHFYSKNLKQKKPSFIWQPPLQGSDVCSQCVCFVNWHHRFPPQPTKNVEYPYQTPAFHISSLQKTEVHLKTDSGNGFQRPKKAPNLVLDTYISVKQPIACIYIYIHIHNLHKYAYAKRTRIYIRTSICIYLYLSVYPPISWFIYMSHRHTVGLLSKAWCECNFLNKRNALATLRPTLDSKQNLCGECIFSGSHVKSH